MGQDWGFKELKNDLAGLSWNASWSGIQFQ